MSKPVIIFQNTPIPILATGNGWLAVDKPANVSVHNEPGKDLCSIVNQYITGLPELQNRLDFEAEYGLHPVHRLDRETSGVVILACRKEIFRYFSLQFATQAVGKTYDALVHGALAVPEGRPDGGEWTWPLSPTAGGRNQPAGKGPKQFCRTRFRILRYSRHYTLIQCEPQTGRRHQIRRHAAMAGHAIVGDRRYGSRRALHFISTQMGFNRLALHCRAMTIKTPEKNEPITIQSQEGFHEVEALFLKDGKP